MNTIRDIVYGDIPQDTEIVRSGTGLMINVKGSFLYVQPVHITDRWDLDIKSRMDSIESIVRDLENKGYKGAAIVTMYGNLKNYEMAEAWDKLQRKTVPVCTYAGRNDTVLSDSIVTDAYKDGAWYCPNRKMTVAEFLRQMGA